MVITRKGDTNTYIYRECRTRAEWGQNEGEKLEWNAHHPPETISEPKCEGECNALGFQVYTHYN